MVPRDREVKLLAFKFWTYENWINHFNYARLFYGNSQEGKLINNEIIHFELISKTDTIDFIVADSVLIERKPIMLFCQGSMPIPLVFEVKKGFLWVFGGGISNFDVNEIKKTHHVVVISMPNTPLVANISALDQNYAFIGENGEKNTYLNSFLLNDHMGNYLDRVDKVLDFLYGQSWVISNDLLVAGHSQGAKIALKIAATRKDVSAVALFALNPMARVDEMIRRIRLDAEKGKVDWDYAEEKTKEYYQFVADFNNPDSVMVQLEYTACKSFSKPLINDLLTIECPVYIAYGGQDISASLCDVLPIYFMEQGKQDYVLKRYPLLDHNFFHINQKDEQVTEWSMVVSSFYNWALESTK